MTPALIEAWVGADGQREIDEERARTGGPGVQTPAAICEAVDARAALLNRLAARLYSRWAKGLSR
jgi:hypothetical protein